MKKSIQLIPTRMFSTTNEKALLPENIVRVRVWRSGYHDKDKNQFVYSNVFNSIISGYLGHEPNIGHVSLELKNVYISLWPNNLTITNKTKPQDGSLDSSVIVDERAEGRSPDLIVDFASLDTSQIIKDVEHFKSSGSQYHLFGGNRFFNTSNSHNCSGLAYKLLHEAGLNNFKIPKNYFRDYMLVTPNNLITYLEIAKKIEIENCISAKSEKSNIQSKQ